MKIAMLLMWLLLLISVANGMEITCYNAEKQIYHGFSEDVYLSDGFIIFFDEKENKDTYINADCVIVEKPFKPKG